MKEQQFPGNRVYKDSERHHAGREVSKMDDKDAPEAGPEKGSKSYSAGFYFGKFIKVLLFVLFMVLLYKFLAGL